MYISDETQHKLLFVIVALIFILFSTGLIIPGGPSVSPVIIT